MTTDAAGPEFDGPALDQLAGMAELGPSRWRKLPVEIEAWRVQTHNLAEVAAWCSGVAYDDETPWDHDTGAVIMPDGRFAHVGYRNWGVIIPALEGDMLAKFGWWVIKGEAGEFYPCDPGVFEQTCEPADAPQTLAEASEAMLPPPSALLAPGGRFEDIAFFGHLDHTGYVTEAIDHGGNAVYRIDLPEKIWGGNPLAEIEYAASAKFSRKPVTEESVRAQWEAERARAERWRQQQAEWERAGSQRALPAGDGSGEIGDDEYERPF